MASGRDETRCQVVDPGAGADQAGPAGRGGLDDVRPPGSLTAHVRVRQLVGGGFVLVQQAPRVAPGTACLPTHAPARAPSRNQLGVGGLGERAARDLLL